MTTRRDLFRYAALGTAAAALPTQANAASAAPAIPRADKPCGRGLGVSVAG